MGISDYEVSAVDTTGNDSVPASVTVTRHIGLRSTSSAAASASTTISIPRPSGAAAGDVLVATITVLGSATVSTPAGWQLVRRDANGTALSQQIYTHLVASGETGPAQWTFSASSTASGVMAAYVGVDPVTPVDVAGGQANSSSTQITAPSVTARVDNGALVVVAGIAANATVQPAAVLLERAEQLAGAGKNRVASELADQSLQSGGATGARTAIASKAGASIGQVLVLRPSSAPAPQPTAPSAPLNPRATGSSSSILVAWDAPQTDGGAQITEYRVFRDGVLVQAVGATARSYTDSAVLSGVSYSYVVRAVNAVGEGTGSTPVTAQIAAAPSAPRSLTASATGRRAIQLSWTAPASNGGSAITGYRVLRSTTSGGSYSLIATLGTGTSYRTTGLTSGQTYFFVVEAINAAGTGPQSNEASATAR